MTTLDQVDDAPAVVPEPAADAFDAPFSVLDLDALPARIRDHIQVGEEGCWLWTGRLTKNGYGRLYLMGREVSAARAIWDLFVRPIGKSTKELDHRCPGFARRSCVNPDHIAWVSRRENTLRSGNPCAVNARKVACKRGHPLSGDNLGWSKRGNGQRFRVCRTCQREARRA